jgi:hypothetical protein
MFPFMLVLAALMLVGPAGCSSPEREVSNSAELKSAIEAAEPGNRIILHDGTYDVGGDLTISVKASADAPFEIVAKNRGKAVITGPTRFFITGSEHIVIEGLTFRSTRGPAIELRGSRHVRITRNHFQLEESERSSWVMIDGIKGDTVTLSGYNRIDHNGFEKKSQLGNFITVEGTKRGEPQVSQHDRIDHNLFADIGPRAENVLEAIRIGSSMYSLSSGYTVLEHNLFERCDGDPEYISIKSSHDTIRYNTFRECLGSLSLRHGNGSVVEGNYILGNGRTGSFLDSTGKTWTLGTGGVRFCGSDMTIVGNYFEGVTGTEWDATMAVTGGDAEYGDGQPLTKHFRIRNATIAGNLLVNNAEGMEFGYNGGGFQGNWWPMAPIDMRIENNVIVGTTGTLIKFYNPPLQTTWKDNLVWPTGKAAAMSRPINGVRVADPKLQQTDGIWHLPGRVPERKPLTRTDVGPWAP